MLDSTNENASRPGEAQSEITNDSIMPTAEPLSNRNEYFKVFTNVDGVCIFVMGADVDGVFDAYKLLFKQGDDFYIAHDQRNDEIVICWYDGKRDVVGERIPYSPDWASRAFFARGMQ
jgi:hypothetical protein